jgi:type I restriction enzyme M protein
MGTLIDRVHRELTEADIAKIVSTYHAWRGDSGESGVKYEDVPGFCKSATTKEIEAHGFVLTPGRYVGFEESAKLEAAIKANLKGLGFGL